MNGHRLADKVEGIDFTCKTSYNIIAIQTLPITSGKRLKDGLHIALHQYRD